MVCLFTLRAGEQELTKPLLLERSKLAVGYITRNCDKYGKFVYRDNIDPKFKYRDKYNLLRHCGTVYALAMAGKVIDDPAINQTIKKACAYLHRNHFLAGVPGQKNMKAIWTIPEKLDDRAARGNAIVAKLGGAGLGLLALCEDYRLGGMTSKGDLIALGNFILFMQKPDGEFYFKYSPDYGFDELFISLYYTGEAILGLLTLYEIDPDPKWLKAADFGLYFLATMRKRTGHYVADHWVLLASAKFYKHYNKLKRPAMTRQMLFFHAGTICKVMIKQQVTDPRVGVVGSYYMGGQTCPTSIRVEGMMGAYSFLPDEYAALKKEIFASCTLAVKFLLQAQITEGELSGGFPRSTLKLDGKDKRVLSNNRRMNEVRIDYVQHALSAIVMYFAIM